MTIGARQELRRECAGKAQLSIIAKTNPRKWRYLTYSRSEAKNDDKGIAKMPKRHITKLVTSVGLISIICLAALRAHAEDFTVVGPGGGGAMFNATISPHDPNEVLIACDMTGSYISHDGGSSWRMFN